MLAVIYILEPVLIVSRLAQNKALRSCIPLCDVAKVERTDVIPYGLVLQTKDGKRYLLSFENDGDLYGAYELLRP